MPVTRSRTYLDVGLEDSNNTTGFLFDDEESTNEARASQTNNDGFASLFRSQNYSVVSGRLLRHSFRLFLSFCTIRVATP